jgi:hypothetical protein
VQVIFGAIPLLGAVRAAMITNLEPVLGIAFACSFWASGCRRFRAPA